MFLQWASMSLCHKWKMTVKTAYNKKKNNRISYKNKHKQPQQMYKNNIVEQFSLKWRPSLHSENTEEHFSLTKPWKVGDSSRAEFTLSRKCQNVSTGRSVEGKDLQSLQFGPWNMTSNLETLDGFFFISTILHSHIFSDICILTPFHPLQGEATQQNIYLGVASELCACSEVKMQSGLQNGYSHFFLEAPLGYRIYLTAALRRPRSTAVFLQCHCC